MRYLAVAAYLFCIVAANWALQRWGFVSVGFGLVAPVGVWFAGLAFSARDAVQEAWGRYAVLPVIAVGAALSWFIEPAFAVASGVAFLVSELADWNVYSRLRESGKYGALAASNVVGAVIDSWLFLWLAFGSIAHWQGLVLGKLWTIIPVLFVMWIWRRDLSERLRSPQPA